MTFNMSGTFMSSAHLKREMTGTQLLFLSFAAIFGSGWLFAPLYAAQIAGPAALLAWLLGGVMSVIIGLTMAEVVALYPKTGGLTHISKITHGSMLSISITILNLLVFLILPAIEVRAVMQYSSSYVGGLMNGEDFTLLGYFLSFFLLMLITLVNLYGAKITARLTELVVFFKVMTPVLICISFFYALMKSGLIDNARLFEGSPSLSSVSWNAIFKAIATSGIIFSFNGFSQAALYAGEARNPQKTVPFAILGSLLLSSCLYILVQYVFLMAIPQQSLQEGWAHISFPGDQGPFVGLSALLGLTWILSLVYADAIISPLGTGFAYASAAPRLIYSLGESTPALKPLLKLNRFGVASFTILFTFVAECLAFLFLPSLKMMIAVLVAAFVLCYTVAPASLLVLRKREPNAHRPFCVSSPVLISYLSMLFSNLMVFSCGWVALRNLSILAAVLISFLVFLQRHASKQFLGCLWFLLQLLGILVLSYIDHLETLAFPTVLVSVAGISALSLYLAYIQDSKSLRT